MATFSLGIIGYGGFGRFLHRAWEPMDQVEVGAIADVNEQSIPEGVAFYSEWRDLLADPAIDVVSIATPPFTHAQLACAALEAGKHVLVEKPLATTLDDARRVMQAERETGSVAGVDYMLRFNPVVEAMQAWCRNEWFGKLRRVIVENYAQDEDLPPEHWFWQPEQSGGILVEHGVHFIDLVHGCTTAAPLHVSGRSVRRSSGQEDRMMATITYEDGLVASHYHAFSRPRFFEHTTLRFVFDLAQVEVEGWIPQAGRVRALVDDTTIEHLDQLPHFEVAEKRPLTDNDGAADEEARRIYSSGAAYSVKHEVLGAFAMKEAKPDAYAASLRALLDDFVSVLDSTSRERRVTLDDGLSSLEVALEATRQARKVE